MNKQKNLIYNLGAVFIVFLTLLVISITANQFAERDHIGLNEPRSIRVSGEEVAYEAPDRVRLTFSVVTQGEEYGEATERNSQQMEEVRNYFRDEGIPEASMRTLNFNISPQYEDIENRSTSREIVGYQVENSLEIQFDDLTGVDELIDGGINSGANRVSGLSFEVSNEEEIKREIRKKAIENAREEAESVADSLGVSLGRVLDFSESRDLYRPRVAMEMMEDAADGSVPIEPGESEIRSSVEVIFEIN